MVLLLLVVLLLVLPVLRVRVRVRVLLLVLLRRRLLLLLRLLRLWWATAVGRCRRGAYDTFILLRSLGTRDRRQDSCPGAFDFCHPA